jgi:aryl-alcohol dehydrogenase-like predicted oxidoreductase
MNFGPRTSEEDAHAIMDIAHEAGINFFDTANRSAASRARPKPSSATGSPPAAAGGGGPSSPPRSTARWGVGPTKGRLSALNIRRALDASTGVRRIEGRAAQSLAEHRKEIQGYEDLAAEIGAEPGTLALAWLLTRPAVSAPIISPRTRDQLDGALPAVELSLSPEHLRRLDDIFPGHQTAPEDYAW